MKIDKRIKIIAVLAVGIILGWLAWQKFFFRVTSISPGGKNISVYTPYIDVNFNMEIATNADISSSDTIVRNVVYEKKKIRLELRELTLDKKYTIDLKQVRSLSGKELSKTYTFTAKDIPFDSLSKDDQKAMIDAQDQEPTTTDPILAHLPYGGLGFMLEAQPDNNEGENKHVKINAQLLLNRVDMDDPNEAQQRYKQEIQDYFTSIDIDINNYLIEYTVVEPSLY